MVSSTKLIMFKTILKKILIRLHRSLSRCELHISQPQALSVDRQSGVTCFEWMLTYAATSGWPWLDISDVRRWSKCSGCQSHTETSATDQKLWRQSTHCMCLIRGDWHINISELYQREGSTEKAQGLVKRYSSDSNKSTNTQTKGKCCIMGYSLSFANGIPNEWVAEYNEFTINLPWTYKNSSLPSIKKYNFASHITVATITVNRYMLCT